MNLNNLFINSLPSLDLHGFDRDSARVALEDFIRDSIKMKQKYIVVIHGIGAGILRSEVRRVLRNNRFVVNFAVSFENPGCTIVEVSSDR